MRIVNAIRARIRLPPRTSPPKPDPPEAPLSAQAQLAAVLSKPIAPPDVAMPPTVTADSHAVGRYEEIGRADAHHPGADEHTGPARPERPSAAAVRNSSRALLDRLDERWEQTKALYETGRLGQVPTPPVHMSREILRHVWLYWLILAVVLGAGITAELVYGIRAAELLTAADHRIALLGAIAFCLAINGLAWYAADKLFRSNKNIVRTNGTKFAAAAALLVVALAVLLGLVVGGFDPIRLDTIDGGSTAVAGSTTSHARWTLAAAYTLILLVVSSTIAAGHLLILDKSADLQVTIRKGAELRAKQASLDSTERTALVISLGEAIIEAIPLAHRAGRQYVEVYNASFSHHAPVHIVEIFLTVEYDDRDPEWLAGLREYLDNLRTDDEQQASVTRIA